MLLAVKAQHAAHNRRLGNREDIVLRTDFLSDFLCLRIICKEILDPALLACFGKLRNGNPEKLYAVQGLFVDLLFLIFLIDLSCVRRHGADHCNVK